MTADYYIKGIKRAISYALTHSEYAIMLFAFAGLVTFNKSFAYVGMGNIYVTEFLSIVCLLGVGFKFLHRRNSGLVSYNKETIQYVISNFWPLLLILFYAIVRLVLDIDYGFQAVRHSMIFFYTVLFTLLFISTVRNEKQLFFLFVYVLIILSSLFNGTKIILYKYLDYTLNYDEPERVFHVETDTICASISLLGLLVYRNYFLKKSKILFVVLIALNLIILFLTVKRSAAISIVPSLIIYALLTKTQFRIRKVFLFLAAIAGIISLSILVWNFISPESIHHYWDYLYYKFSPHEINASWRLEAWKIAWRKFIDAPLWGIGYGPKIITSPINNVDTNDPHNSYLAFLVRHGCLIFCAYLFFIIKTYVTILREVRIAPRGSIQYQNAVFICLGLSSLVVFAFFNVVLENQYEGIFFNFFLSAIYVARAQRLNLFYDSNSSDRRMINYAVIAVAVIFVFYGIISLNRPATVFVYSANTNYSMPTAMKNNYSQLTVLSSKDTGINVSCKNDQRSYSELLWFFPPRADNIDFKEYSLCFESNFCLTDKMQLSLLYEDKSRIPLSADCENSWMRADLRDIPNRKQGKIKIKYIVMTFNTRVSFDNFIIRNIYIERRKDTAKNVQEALRQ